MNQITKGLMIMQHSVELAPVPAAAGSRLMQAVVQHAGEVERVFDGTVVLSTAAGIQQATVALSCLVQPAIGDVVLVAPQDEQLYVLAVLHRSGSAPIQMRFQRDTQLQVAGALAIESSNMKLAAKTMEISAVDLNVWTRTANWVAEVFDCAARNLRQVAQSASLRTKAYQRHVEGMEVVRTGHLDMQAEQLMHLRASNTVVKAKELVKVDGKLIQVG
jgi:hypothetical protein